MTCPLCESLKKEDRLIIENESAFSMVILEPLKRGHVLILPKRHVTTMSELTEKESKDILILIKQMQDALKSKYNEGVITHINDETFRSQEHLHFHILPSKYSIRELISKMENVPERRTSSSKEMKEINLGLQKTLKKSSQ